MDAYISEIKIFSFNFAPKNWAQCNGQLLPINTNQALFSLLGVTYGGNGQTTFALPDLRGRVPMKEGSNLMLGQKAGAEAHTLTQSEMAAHSHSPLASATKPDTNTPVGNTWAPKTGFAPYASELRAPATMATNTLTLTGGSQPHENRSPYLVLNYCIALIGIFPSQN